jgi:hypothetical protein
MSCPHRHTLAFGIPMLALVAAVPCAGADIYRCTVDGKTIYSDTSCPATGKKLALPSNTVGEVDQKAYREKSNTLAKENAARNDTRAKTNAAAARDAAAFGEQCQALRDTVARQRASLQTISGAARVGAEMEIRTQLHKLHDFGCE